MSAALMFAARHLTRYLTAAARTNGNAPSRPANVCENVLLHVYHNICILTYAPSSEDRTRRVELRTTAPLALSYSRLLVSILITIAWAPLMKPPLDCALRPPADDTVCKQRKNATRLFSPAIRIVVGRR